MHAHACLDDSFLVLSLVYQCDALPPLLTHPPPPTLQAGKERRLWCWWWGRLWCYWPCVCQAGKDCLAFCFAACRRGEDTMIDCTLRALTPPIPTLTTHTTPSQASDGRAAVHQAPAQGEASPVLSQTPQPRPQQVQPGGRGGGEQQQCLWHGRGERQWELPSGGQYERRCPGWVAGGRL